MADVVTAIPDASIASANANPTVAGQVADPNNPLHAASGGTPALITTSNASRANYSTNVTGLTAALSSTSATPSPTQAVRYDSSGNVYNQPDGKGGYYSGPVAQAPGTLMNMPDGNGGYYSGPAAGAPVVKPAAPSTTAPAGSTGAGGSSTAASGSTAAPDSAGGGTGGNTTTDDADAETQAVAGLPPSIASLYKQSLATQDQNITNAQNALATAAATVQNDPAAAQAASAISAQYDVLINAMKEKNRQIIGGYTANAARSGGLQYANDMTENFMSEEMDKASQRISDLVAKEQSLILASNNAYKNNDVKAFNAAQTALEKATNDKTTALGKLLTATQNQVKAVQAQQKIDQTTAKNQLAADTTTATKIAAGMVTALKAAGITDPAAIQQYVQEMATKNGITNPDILAGALATAQQTQAKTDASLANTASTIAKRNATGSSSSTVKGGGTDGGYKYTGDDVASYTSLLNKGGAAPDGTTYAPRGTDGYVDPEAYVAAYTDWVANNGTPAGFLKKFPITNVNPTSIPTLPQALQPKTKTPTPTYSTSTSQ